MKKIILAAAIFIAINNFCFSQEEIVEKKNFKPKSRVGGSVGYGLNMAEMFDTKDNHMEDIRIDIFYHKTLSKFWYLSLSAGYINCFNKNNYIPVTVGVNFLYPNDFIIPYFGCEIGVSNRLNLRGDRTRTGLLVGLIYGISKPIPKHNISLGFDIKIQIATQNTTGFIGGSWVISYLLPSKKRKEK